MAIKNNKPKKANVNDIKKLKLLFTIVDRSKALFYIDFFEQYETNFQMICLGQGTADSDMLNYLGLASSEKAVILSVVQEDLLGEILPSLNEKFEKVKNGKGIAFTVPFKSMIGVAAYRFLVNDRPA